MDFSEKIKAICKEKNISIFQLEKDLGFSNGYIRKLKDKIPTDRALMISNYLGLPSDYFMPAELKKDSPVSVNPLIEKIMLKANSCSDAELEQILDYANYVLSKR